MYYKMPRAAFQWIALGAVQYLATARTAFETFVRVNIHSHIKLPINSWNGPFSTPSSSSTPSSYIPTRSGTLCLEVTQNVSTNSSAKVYWDIVMVPISFPCVVATSLPSQFTQALDGDHKVQLVLKYITPGFQSYSKNVIDVHNHDVR